MQIGYLRKDMLTGELADETTGPPICVMGYPYVSIYIKGTGTTSSGVITIETADFNPSTETNYSGTWSSVTTVNASDVDGTKQKLVALTVAEYSFIRARISTVIGGGGTISAVLVAS